MTEISTQELSSQIKKISDHLVFLEKKLDTLIEQTKDRKPAFAPKFGGGNRDFQRPRSGGFGRPSDGPRGNFGRPDGPRGNFGRSSGDRPQYGPRREGGNRHSGGNHSQGKFFSNKSAR